MSRGVYICKQDLGSMSLEQVLLFDRIKTIIKGKGHQHILSKKRILSRISQIHPFDFSAIVLDWLKEFFRERTKVAAILLETRKLPFLYRWLGNAAESQPLLLRLGQI